MTTDLMGAVRFIHERAPQYANAQAYYEGTNDEVLTRKMRRLLQAYKNKFRLNFARIVVTTVLDRLEVQEISGEDTDTLQAIWEFNELDQEANHIHEQALVNGDAYVMVWPDENGLPQVIPNSPLTTAVFYDEENGRQVRYAAKVWAEEESTRVNLYYPDRIEKYIAEGTLKPTEDGQFKPYVDDEEGVWPLPNPYGEVPIFHFRTARQYGRPEHRDAYGPQDAINKLVATQMATVDFAGFPQRYAVMASDSSVDSSAYLDPGDDGTGQAGTMSKLDASPGGLWWLEGIDKIGEFSATDQSVFLEPMQQYVRALASSTSTPLHYFESLGGVPSGESLRASESSLNKKVLTRQQLFGSTWAQVMAFALSIVGRTPGMVTVVWASPVSTDDKDAVEVAKLKLELGVPLETVLRELGYEPTEVTAEGLAA